MESSYWSVVTAFLIVFFVCYTQLLACFAINVKIALFVNCFMCIIILYDSELPYACVMRYDIYYSDEHFVCLCNDNIR
mgnify:CR=1 FL=1